MAQRVIVQRVPVDRTSPIPPNVFHFWRIGCPDEIKLFGYLACCWPWRPAALPLTRLPQR
jgi:hypothetical protein